MATKLVRVDVVRRYQTKNGDWRECHSHVMTPRQYKIRNITPEEIEEFLDRLNDGMDTRDAARSCYLAHSSALRGAVEYARRARLADRADEGVP